MELYAIEPLMPASVLAVNAGSLVNSTVVQAVLYI